MAFVSFGGTRMQDKGSVDQDGWGALIAFCESERRRIFERLEPLEDGTIQMGRRGPETGGVWVDTTTEDIQRLRKALANIDAALAQARNWAR
jgi:hypothetical protein